MRKIALSCCLAAFVWVAGGHAAQAAAEGQTQNAHPGDTQSINQPMQPRDWIALGGLIATFLVSVAAIYGEKIRASLFKPKLSVMLDDPRGVFFTETISATAGYTMPASGMTASAMTASQLQQYTRPARYYYLTVRAERRWPQAHDVRILMTRLERPDPGGLATTVWTGEIPFQWEHAQIQPASRTLGHPARANFVVTAQDPREVTERRNQLHLMTVIEPSNMPRSYYAATKFWVTVTATSIESDSPRLRLEVSWDGQWDAGETEMGQHLKIRPA
jgi:hypothetical protein